MKRSKAPRIALTLKPETVAVLGELARLQKRPRSAVAADLLEEMTPALKRLSAVLEAATSAQKSLPATSTAKLDELTRVLELVADHGMTRLEAEVSAADARGARRAPGKRRKGH